MKTEFVVSFFCCHEQVNNVFENSKQPILVILSNCSLGGKSNLSKKCFSYITMFLLLRNLLLKLLISEFSRTFHSRIHVSFGTILSLIQHFFSLYFLGFSLLKKLKTVRKIYFSHCLDLDLNGQKTRRNF